MTDGSERRRHKRVAVTWNGEARKDPESAISVEIANISEAGVGIVSFKPMYPGEYYVIQFTAWKELPIGGVVRWSDVGEVQTYAGIQFVAPSKQQLAALRELIARYDKEDWGL